MEKVDYNQKLNNIINSLDEKKNLLLHCCCAPCASSVIERLLPDFNIKLFFYNPNINTKEEYDFRAKELMRLAGFFKLPPPVICDYIPEEFYSSVKNFESEKEGGKRCENCFGVRLIKAAEAAKKGGFDFFATTLTVSPHKNAALINETGTNAETAISRSVYLPSDFKKQNGYKRSAELSRELNLYRQGYCGCEFSYQDFLSRRQKGATKE